MQRQAAATAALVAKGYPAATAQITSLKMMDLAVTQQATMLSYNDAWMLILISFVVVAPAVFILRKPRPVSPAAMGGH